jgi:hypothetical protein
MKATLGIHDCISSFNISHTFKLLSSLFSLLFDEKWQQILYFTLVYGVFSSSFDQKQTEQLKVSLPFVKFWFLYVIITQLHTHTHTHTHIYTHTEHNTLQKREQKKAKGARKKTKQVEAYQRTQAITKKKS